MTHDRQIPQDGLAGLRENWKSDLLSGFVVFLIAMPLSLGIAMASGAPPMAGIITAFAAGLIVSLVGGSHLTINGPAAGLIVVVLNAIHLLGGEDAELGYYRMMVATAVSGVLLALLGLLRAGKLGDFFPLAAVHGMMAAIGLIIISKQFHLMFGVKPQGSEPLLLFLEIPQTLSQLNPAVSLIGVGSLLLLIYLNFYAKNPWLKKIPAPLIVVIFGTVTGLALKMDEAHTYTWFGQSYPLDPRMLVSLPTNFGEGIKLAHFWEVMRSDVFLTGVFWQVVITITLIQGLESLLSASAVAQLDPWKRPVNLNRDLIALGASSVVSGALGGMPMIAEIIRSSANISNGARTRWSNFFHGLFILLAVVFFPALINQIPLACLAALLVFTGYRLASPREFVRMYEIGWAQLFIFLITVIGVLVIDLLAGIGLGILAKVIVSMVYGARPSSIFSSGIAVSALSQHDYVVKIDRAAMFTNYLGIKSALEKLPEGCHVIVDFSDTQYVDHTAIEHLMHFKSEYNHKGGHLHFKGLEGLRPLSHHHLSARRRTPEDTDHVRNMSLRAQSLAVFAEEANYAFSPHREAMPAGLRRFDQFKGAIVDYQENFVDGQLGLADIHFQVSDIQLKTGAHFTLDRTKFTGMLLTHLPVSVPDFLLSRQTAPSLILSITGYQDIDFSSHPDFSNRYLLSARKEADVRAFFKPPLLSFLEKNDHYTLQVQNNGVFIHREQKLLSEADIQQMIAFARALILVMQGKPVEQKA